MVSSFVPRGRFLIEAISFRQAQQKQQYSKWQMLRCFRQNPENNLKSRIKSGSATNGSSQNQTKIKVDTLIKKRTYSGFGYKLNKSELQHRQEVWKKWTSFLLRWSPIGICVFGVIEWQFHRQRCDHDNRPRTASQLQTHVYCSLPLRIMSRCWGWLASCYVPTSMRPYVYGWYSSTFNVNIDEALYPDFKHYNSLSEFFTRPLRNDARLISETASLVSPADGKVLHYGSASNSLVEQVKGVNYRIESFLGPVTWKERAKNDIEDQYHKMIKEKEDDSTSLYQCVIYLAPGDYHRFHSPAQWQPTIRRHFAGELLSVNPKIAHWLPELFCLNERVVYLGKWDHGFFSYTAVGATNVGSVQIYMDENLKTNKWNGLKIGQFDKKKSRDNFDEIPLNDETLLKKGDLVGQFNMGSTIVLLFEAPKNFEFNIKPGQKVRVGEPLGHIKDNEKS